MKTYKIFSDSTTDITPAMAKELDVEIIPLSYILDGVTYQDGVEEGAEGNSIQMFYEKLAQGATASTTQVNAEDFMLHFEPALKAGQDILYLAFSSGLSGTCQSAMIAKKELQEKYPQRRIEVFDSLAASMGEGLFLYYTAKKRLDGMELEDLLRWMKENVLRVAHWFTVDDLHSLKRGGRISTATAILGTVLGIKPVLHVDDAGHLIPYSKVRGRKQSLDALVKRMEQTGIQDPEQVVFISHANAIADAKYIEAEIKRKFHVKNVYINYIGTVIGSHTGPGCIALFFMGNER